MARRIEGTVTGGFVCDEVGCNDNAIWSPIFCTPYLGKPDWDPILTFTDIHCCANHWRGIRRELATDHMRDAIREIANQKGAKPDFDGMFLSRIAPFHPDYHRFQVQAGLIPPDDAMGPEVVIDLRGEQP
jgi:hypothetical protein